MILPGLHSLTRALGHTCGPFTPNVLRALMVCSSAKGRDTHFIIRFVSRYSSGILFSLGKSTGNSIISNTMSIIIPPLDHKRGFCSVVFQPSVFPQRLALEIRSIEDEHGISWPEGQCRAPAEQERH